MLFTSSSKQRDPRKGQQQSVHSQRWAHVLEISSETRQLWRCIRELRFGARHSGAQVKSKLHRARIGLSGQQQMKPCEQHQTTAS
eukprot:scaffold134504_cov47-Prasinocladus_malaysianus.AAC.1